MAYKRSMAFRSDLLTTGLHIIATQNHVTSDTRPSHSSACNIEKPGMGMGRTL